MQSTKLTPDLDYHRNGKNLHINLSKEPDARTLISMSDLLKNYGDGTGRVFVDVRNLNEGMHQTTIRSLKELISSSRVPARSIYFKGPMGFTLASDGNRVLIRRGKDDFPSDGAIAKAAARFTKISHKCRCGGKCGNKCCQVTGGPCCSERRQHHHQSDSE